MAQHWGKWVQQRSRFVGFRRQIDFAKSIGCSTKQVQKWEAMGVPPTRMRKGFGESLAKALSTTPPVLFSQWSKVPPEHKPADAALAASNDYELVREVNRRRKSADDLLEENLDRAEKIDWSALLTHLNSVKRDSQIPVNLHHQSMTIFGLFAAHDKSTSVLGPRIKDARLETLLRRFATITSDSAFAACLWKLNSDFHFEFVAKRFSESVVFEGVLVGGAVGQPILSHLGFDTGPIAEVIARTKK
jgi:hypothetical protein